MKNAMSVLKDFCTAYFVRRNAEAALGFLSGGVHWFSASANAEVKGRSEAKEIITREISAMPGAYTLCFSNESESELGGGASLAFAHLLITNDAHALRVMLRLSCGVHEENGSAVICALHMSIEDEQSEKVPLPVRLARDDEQRMRQSVIKDALAGGMLGGYCEDGFPLYFIDSHMLAYLGYADEAAFIKATNGLITNAVHPDDRKYVVTETTKQLTAHGERTLEYRMQKCDGSYIWVRDTGRIFKAEDGRDAVAALCVDISAEHEKNEIVRRLMRHMPTGLVVADVDAAGEITVQYISDSVCRFTGVTRAKVKQSVADGSFNAAFAEDIELLQSTVKKLIQTKKSRTVCYRSRRTDGVVVWIELAMRYVAAKNGLGTIYASFTDATERKTRETELSAVLDTSSGAVCIYEVDGKKFTPLYMSDNLGKISSRTNDDYEDMVKEGRKDAVFAQDQKIVFDAMDKTMSTGEVTNVTYRVLDGSGKYVWMNGVYSRQLRPGQLPLMRAVYTSVSEQFQMQTNVLDETVSGIYVINRDTYELYYANKRGFEIYGRKQGDYTGKKCYDVLCGRSTPCADCTLKRFDGSVITAEMYSPEVDRQFSVTTKSMDWLGNPSCIQYLIDITDRKSAEKRVESLNDKLREVNKTLSAVISTAPCAIVSFDVREGNILVPSYMSTGWQSMTGYNVRETILGCQNGGIMGIMPKDAPALRKKLREGVALREKIKGTQQVTCRDGSTMWMAYDLAPITDAGGSLTYCGTFADITNQMDAQQQLNDVIHNVPGGVCLYSYKDGVITPLVISDTLHQLFGISNSSYVDNKRRFDYPSVYPDDLPALRAALLQGIRTGETVKHVYRSQNTVTGKRLWLYLQCNLVTQNDGSVLAYASYTDVTEQKDIERRLRRSEQQLEAATEQAEAWFWTFNPATDTAHVYSAMRRDFGMPEEMPNYPESWLALGFVAPEYVQPYREAFARVKNGEPNVSFEERVQFKDGTKHWVRITFRNMFNDAGEAYITLCHAASIDNEKLLAARLELEKRRPAASKQRLLQFAVFNISKNRLVRCGADVEKAEECHDERTVGEWCEIVAERMTNKADKKEFIEKHNLDTLRAGYEAGESDYMLEYRYNTTKQVAWVRDSMRVLRDPETDDLLLFEYCFDIQNEKLDALAKEKLVVEGYEFLVIADTRSDSGRTVQVSSSYNDDYYPVIEQLDKTVSDYILSRSPDADKAETAQKTQLANVCKQLETQSVYDIYFNINDTDGKVHRKRMSYSYIDKENGLICQTRSDITKAFEAEQRRNAELTRALTAANAATKAKTDFLSRMSHEIRTPMNAIMGMTDIARGALDDRPQVADSLEKIELSSRYLLTLINDILDVSRIESGRLEISDGRFEFDALINGVNTIIGTLADKAGVVYTYAENAAPEAEYYGDIMRIQQVLVNVLSNAVKFTPRGGFVRFTADIESQTDNAARFKFTVADTGKGIGKAFLPHIFSAFAQEDSGTTSEYGGSGLGLAISQSIVKAMQGELDVKSEQGKGTVFTVILPLGRIKSQPAPNVNTEKHRILQSNAQPDADVNTEKPRISEPNADKHNTQQKSTQKNTEFDAAMHNSAQKSTQKNTEFDEAMHNSTQMSTQKNTEININGCHVLLAEDHPLNVTVATKLLERRGVTADVANNGKQAVDMFAAAKPGKYDMVLMDIRMPVMDGIDATKAIRALPRKDAAEIPIIAMTANALADDRRRTAEAGMNAHLSKPIEPALLYQTVAQYYKKQK